MKNPRILLSGNGERTNYIDAVNALDGIAVLEPPASGELCDGLILTGGCDVDPSYYGESQNGAVGINPERDKAEFALIEQYVAGGKPIMGICRGLQILNVYFGGSLFQHLPEAEKHVRKDETDRLHPVIATKGSVVEKCYGTSFTVNSAHHQAIKRLGEGLAATAEWEGKVIEAIEHRSLPIFAVQWHPERIGFLQRREGASDGEKLFRHFFSIL